MKITDNRESTKAKTFRDLQIGDVFEKLIEGQSDSGIWIKTDYSDGDNCEWDEFNAFRLGNDPAYTEIRFGYFNASAPVRKLNVELTILGEAE